MKDYYYFLGISKNASDEEIKKSYRKLSLKYHPDKNDNDAFFTERFREITEAYETLMDPYKRKIYDEGLEKGIKFQKSDLPPIIKNFHATKIRAREDEEIKISWQTYHADLVKIMPFGLEKSQGERIFKIKEFDQHGKFQILLQATNTHLRQSIAQGITIQRISDVELSRDEDSFNNEPIITEKDSFQLSNKRIFALISLVVILVLLYLLSRNEL